MFGASLTPAVHGEQHVHITAFGPTTHKDADMSLAEFARWEIVTGGFAEIFLDGTDGLDSFDFIGITERFDEDLAKLAHRLNWTTTPRPGVRANTTPKDPTPVDAATRQVIERHHEFEVDFYRRAAERFA